MADAVFDQLAACGVVPVIAIERVENAVPLADALVEGGITAIEITFRTDAAASAIRQIADERPNMLVGAGTVLTAEQVVAAAEAGATYALAPGCSADVIAAADDARLPFIPGVCTPSDIERALALGRRLLKFFPAGAMGGVPMLNALAGPYKHTGVRFVPTGGVSVDTVEAYLACPIVAAVGGTWLATASDIRERRWDAIAARAAEAVALVRSVRTPKAEAPA